MKCLHCHKREAAELTANESPDGKPFTLGLCKECLEKVLKQIINITEDK